MGKSSLERTMATKQEAPEQSSARFRPCRDPQGCSSDNPEFLKAQAGWGGHRELSSLSGHWRSPSCFFKAVNQSSREKFCLSLQEVFTKEQERVQC